MSKGLTLRGAPSSTGSAIDREFSAGLNSWDEAPAPAQFGRRLIVGILRVELAPERARLINNIVHWAIGVGWGAAAGLVSGSFRTRRAWHGLILGAGVWAQSYVVLVPAKLYRPMWEYDAETLWKDLSAHLVYGLAAATMFRVLAHRSTLRSHLDLTGATASPSSSPRVAAGSVRTSREFASSRPPTAKENAPNDHHEGVAGHA